MNVDINKIIYFYILTCMALLFYNVFFLFYSKLQTKKHHKYSLMWETYIKKQLNRLNNDDSVDEEHKNVLKIRLTNINQLIAYSNVLDKLRNQGEDIDKYLKDIYTVIQFLAYKYKKKEVANRAFFAFFISNNPPCDGKEYNELISVLISFLDDSNIYCRENVLKALYSLGNIQGVLNAFEIINARGWFHHHKLLSDGLMTFKGDQQELAEVMFNNYKNWDENIIISIIKFITFTSDKFKERFFQILQAGDSGIEVQIAIMRYFKKYKYKPVQALFIDYLNGNNNIDENIKIVAASALDNYPGEITVEALTNALKQVNWYTRYNAALSLIKLGFDENNYKDIIENNNNANEMVNYIINLQESRG